MATGIITALAIGTLAVPASAATKGYATFVNGSPGVNVDVCIGNSREIRSSVGYGNYVKKRLQKGRYQFQFRKASPGTCTGRLLAQRRIRIGSGGDKTIVVTPGRERPAVVIFNNAPVNRFVTRTTDVPISSALAVRHAADRSRNKVYFSYSLVHYQEEAPPYSFWFDEDVPFSPAVASTPFDKGDELTSGLAVVYDMIFRIRVTKGDPAVDRGRVYAKRVVELDLGKRYEFIFVGTHPTNVRLVTIISNLPAS